MKGNFVTRFFSTKNFLTGLKSIVVGFLVGLLMPLYNLIVGLIGTDAIVGKTIAGIVLFVFGMFLFGKLWNWLSAVGWKTN